MSTWTLYKVTADADVPAPAGFHVLDCNGVPIGRVAGVLAGLDGTTHMLVVTIFRWQGDANFLVPLGGFFYVNQDKKRVGLHGFTRDSLLAHAWPLAEGLPHEQDAIALLDSFPNPRPLVHERLHLAHLAFNDASYGITMHSLPSSGKNAPTWQPLHSLSTSPTTTSM